MDQERAGMSRQTKTLLIVFGAIGGVLLLCGIGCGGLVFFWARSFANLPNVMTAADGFLDDLAANRVDDAYLRTSRGFQRQSIFQFREFVERYPALTQATSRKYGGFNVFSGTGGTTGTVQATVLAPNNSLSFTLIFVVEDGQWKLDQFNVP